MKIVFHKSLAAWRTPAFITAYKQDMKDLETAQLPLQAALSHSSQVSETPIDPVVLHCSESADAILIKTGIFYGGIIAGSCCADDPTPVCEQTEYCVLLCTINKNGGEVTFELVTD